jgi:aspartate racemase
MSVPGKNLLRLIVLLLAVSMTGLLGGCGISGGPDDGAVTDEAPGYVSGDDGHNFNEDGMKTIGLIGGVSWCSTIEYYRLLNEGTATRLGGLHSARLLMYSIEFGEFSQEERLAADGDWVPLRNTMVDAARRLKAGGADFIIIASNTLNSTAELLEAKVGLPVLHIADAVGQGVEDAGLKKVILLGTAYTMEEDFYRQRLEKNHGLTVLIPDAKEREYINAIIFDELCAGKITPEARQGYVRIIERMVREEGAEGVILGCTEIPLLIKQTDVSVPVFDSTAIHVEATLDYALAEVDN